MNAWELAAGVLLALAAVWYVMGPVLRPAATSPGTGAAPEGADAEDDVSPRTVALRALKEIEFDRATGKLGDADYNELKQRYTAEALAALRGEEGAGRKGEEARSQSPRPGLACPVHGPVGEPDATFCPACVRRRPGVSARGRHGEPGGARGPGLRASRARHERGRRQGSRTSSPHRLRLPGRRRDGVLQLPGGSPLESRSAAGHGRSGAASRVDQILGGIAGSGVQPLSRGSRGRRD